MMPGGLHAPVEVMLTWPAPNFINPEVRPNTLVYLAYILGPFTTCLFLARLWVRIFHQRSPGWDDWLMLCGVIFTIGFTVITPLSATTVFGKHIWDLDLVKDSKKAVTSRKYVLATECIFCVASGFIKVSILLFYRRLSSRTVSTTFVYTTWALIAFIVGYSIVLTLVPIFGCQPISAFWDQVDAFKIFEGYQYKCFNEGADVLAAAIISVVQDFLTALLPTFLYWNLRIPRRQKIALFGIFALGYSISVIGAFRAYFSWVTFFDSYDVTWTTWDLMLSSTLELHIGCFCANAPALRVFFKHYFHDKITSRSRSKYSGQSAESKKKSTGGSHSEGSSFKNIREKLSTLVGSQQSKKGHSEDSSRPSASMELQDRVLVQNDITVVPSTPSFVQKDANRHESSNTTDLIYRQYFDEDIELGRYTIASDPRSSVSDAVEAVREDKSRVQTPDVKPSSLKSVKSYRTLKSVSSKAELLTPPPNAYHQADEGAGKRRERRLTPLPSSTVKDLRPSRQKWPLQA